MPYLASWAPKVQMTSEDTKTKLPTAFTINTSFEFQTAGPACMGGDGRACEAFQSSFSGTITLKGDWGGSTTTQINIPTSSSGNKRVNVILNVRVEGKRRPQKEKEKIEGKKKKKKRKNMLSRDHHRNLNYV